MRTAELVDRLPLRHHNFVRLAMASQIAYAVTFGAPADGRCLNEVHARSIGRSIAWLVDELSAAFPGESWYRIEVDEVEIPHTAEDLLRLIPPSE
jgi:hypothetical protein